MGRLSLLFLEGGWWSGLFFVSLPASRLRWKGRGGSGYCILSSRVGSGGPWGVHGGDRLWLWDVVFTVGGACVVVRVAFRRSCLQRLCCRNGTRGGGCHFRPRVVGGCIQIVSLVTSLGDATSFCHCGTLRCRILINSGGSHRSIEIGSRCEVRFRSRIINGRGRVAVYGVLRLSGRCGWGATLYRA